MSARSLRCATPNPSETLSVLIDHEGQDAGIAIFGGVGDGAETADLVIDDIIISAARRARTLALQDAVEVAVIRNWLLADFAPFAGSLCREFTERPWLFALCSRPVEPVLLAWAAHNVPSIDVRTETIGIKQGIFVLRLEVGK